jgi:shikimate kinase
MLSQIYEKGVAMGKNIVLIGFMGTGKSTVGMRLAERLHLEFVDMDREIERITGMSISQLFRKHGETRFRSEEQLMAQKLGQRTNLVIATGGGVVIHPENVAALKRNGIIVGLEASPEVIMSRVSRKKSNRPLLSKHTTIEDIEKMLASREEYYARADIRVNTTGQELNKVVNEIISQVKRMNSRRKNSSESRE